MYNWIAVLYTWNLHDTVNQLYFNKKILKKEKKRHIKVQEVFDFRPTNRGQMTYKPLDLISTVLWVFALVHFPEKNGHDFHQIPGGVQDPTN